MKRLFILAFAAIGCGELEKAPVDSAAYRDSVWRARDEEMLEAEDTVGWMCGGEMEKQFNPATFFETSDDTLRFLALLFLDKGPSFQAGYDPFRLMTLKPVKLYGKDDTVYFIDIERKSEFVCFWPYRTQFLYDKDGKKLLEIEGENYQFAKIFRNENPFLVVEETTARGNGRHRIYGMSNDSCKNFLNTMDWDLRTISDHGPEITSFEPGVLKMTIADQNGDGREDLLFSGKIICHEYISDARVFPIEYAFVYDKRKQEFAPKINKYTASRDSLLSTFIW